MKRAIWMLVLVIVLLPCAGCELGVLVSNPDAAQAFISGRVDMATDLATNWGVYAAQFAARIDQLFAALAS